MADAFRSFVGAGPADWVLSGGLLGLVTLLFSVAVFVLALIGLGAPRLYRWPAIAGLISFVAGLITTIWGIVDVYHVIKVMGSPSPGDLSNGILQASMWVILGLVMLACGLVATWFLARAKRRAEGDREETSQADPSS